MSCAVGPNDLVIWLLRKAGAAPLRTRRGATREDSVRRFSGGTAGPWVAAATTTVSPLTTSFTMPLNQAAAIVTVISKQTKTHRELVGRVLASFRGGGEGFCGLAPVI